MAEPSERDVIQRITRFSSLRATERALRPSVRLRRVHASISDLGLGLLRALQQLQDDSAATAECRSEMLADIDGDLDALDRALESLVAETPLPQFRANLPSIARSNRAETMALLDFCLATPERRNHHLSLIDYIITLLSSERVGNARCLRSDPAMASPGLSVLSDLLAARYDDSESGKAFRQASYEVLDANDVVSVVERMRAVKLQLGEAILVPEVLRCVVSYNLAVSNRLEVLLDADRALDRGIATTLESLRSLDVGLTAAQPLASQAEAG